MTVEDNVRLGPSVDRLRREIARVRHVLPAGDVTEMLSLIEHGEVKIALEMLLVQAYEYDAPIDQEAFGALEDLTRSFQVDEKYVEVLRPA